MNTTAFSAIQIRYVETVSPGKDRPIYRVFAPVAWSDEQIKAAFVTATRRLVGYLFPANRPPAQASTFDVLIAGDGNGHPLLSDEAHYLHLAVNLATQRAVSSASGRSRTPADIFEIISTTDGNLA